MRHTLHPAQGPPYRRVATYKKPNGSLSHLGPVALALPLCLCLRSHVSYYKLTQGAQGYTTIVPWVYLIGLLPYTRRPIFSGIYLDNISNLIVGFAGDYTP